MEEYTDKENLSEYEGGDDTQSIGIDEAPTDIFPEIDSQSQKKKPSKLLLVILAAVCGAIIVYIAMSIQKEKLKNDLLGEWYAFDDSYTIMKILDFDERSIEYRLETGYKWLDTTLGDYKWEAVGRNKVLITQYGVDTIYTIKLNEEKDVIIVTPAITSTDPSELWVR